MLKVNFRFSGWVRGAEINTAIGGDDLSMKELDVSKLNANEVIAMLNSGKLTISFAKLFDCLRENDDVEADMFDYEISKD